MYDQQEKIPIHMIFNNVDDHDGYNIRHPLLTFFNKNEIIGPICKYVVGINEEYDRVSDISPLLEFKTIDVYLPFGFEYKGYGNLQREIYSGKIRYKNKFTCKFYSDNPYYEILNIYNKYLVQRELVDKDYKYYITKTDIIRPQCFEIDLSFLYTEKKEKCLSIGIIDDQSKARYIRYIPKDYKYYNNIFDNHRYILKFDNSKYYLVEDLYYGE